MNNKEIQEKFGNSLCVKEEIFLFFISNFVELKSWDISGRYDDRQIFIGTVEDRPFYYECTNGYVWKEDGFSFIDEMNQTGV